MLDIAWIKDAVSNALWGWLYDLATDFSNWAMTLVKEFIIFNTDIDTFLDINGYLHWFQIIAASLLITKVSWEGIKQISGGVEGFVATDNQSLHSMIMRTLFSGFLIFFMPWSVTNILIPLNNALLGLIDWIPSSVGSVRDPDALVPIFAAPVETVGAIVLLSLVLSIAAFLLGIVAGIRYVEIIIIVLISPFVAVTAEKDTEGVSVWLREAIAVIFTQCVHFILLKLLVGVIGSAVGLSPIDVMEKNMIAIGILALMIRGPQVLRQFVYSTGTGGALTQAAGSAGRMAVSSMLVKRAFR